MGVVGVRWRKDVGVARDFFWVASFLVVAGLAYFIHHWRHLQLALALFTIPNLVVFFILPESPRWLYAQGRKTEAEAVLRRIARWNGRSLDSDDDGTENIIDGHMVAVSQPKVYMWDIFRYRRLWKRVIIICFIWLTSDLVYYGLSLNSLYLGSDPYLSFILSGLIEAPAYVFCLLALNRFGRRWMVIGTMTWAGLALVICSAVPTIHQHVLVALSTVRKFGITAAYCSVYVYTVEFFPTLVRTSGVGVATFIGQIGGLVAPHIALLLTAPIAARLWYIMASMQGFDYDSVLTKVGEFGRFQRILYALSLIVYMNTGLDILGYVFVSTLPDHWCAVPEVDGLNLTEEEWNWISLPDAGGDNEGQFSRCEMYDRDYSNLSRWEPLVVINQSASLSISTTRCRHGWQYDIRDGRDSFVTEWDLVCNQRFLASATQSVFVAGLMVGVLLSGGLADRFGRKHTVIWSSMMRLICCLLCFVSVNVWMYMVLRFVVAAAGTSASNALFIIIMEVVGARWRKDVGVARDFFWVASFLVVAGLAYFIHHWRHLQLALALFTIPNLAVFFILPESPRWLYAQGRKTEAEAVLRRIARWNGRSLDSDDDGTEKGLDGHIVAVSQPKVYMWDIFRYRRLWKRVIIICFIWLTSDLVYYGLSLNSLYLGSDPYLSFILSGLIEAPAYVFCLLALNRFGRRWMVIGTMTWSGLALVICSTVPTIHQHVLVVLSTVGKFGITAAYCSVYVYTVEFFPTLVRTSGVGVATFIGRIGGLVAPHIALLTEYHPSIPLAIFGAFPLAAGLLVALFLPETTNAALADTLQDAEDVNKTAPTNADVVEFHQDNQCSSTDDDL